MSNLLKNSYDKMEAIKGKRLIYLLLAVFVVFTIIGLSVGYLMSPKLNEDETPVQTYSGNLPKQEKTEASGKITYVNPEMYPMDEISYSLTDSSGKDIYLLSAKDNKLEISEGLYVKVVGTLSKLKDGKTPVLLVEEVIINNVSN
jgi:hypothetical protein